MDNTSLYVTELHNETRVRDYFALLKPRVMSLVIFTGICGMLLAPGSIHPLIALIAILCIAIGSGASGAINMWYDRDIDAIMKRTENRPIPAGRVEPEEALHFGVILAIISVFIMAVAVNLLASALLLGAILFYVLVYTMWLKRTTEQNIVIGGAAGAFPPMIGYAAVTGDISLYSFVLFLIIFMWTPPHFWALALYRSDDYKNANVPMMPVVSGIKTTKINIIVYSVLLFITSLVPYFMHENGMIYLIGALALNMKFVYDAVRVYNSSEYKVAIGLFGYSIVYLFAEFTLLVIDKIL